MRRHLLFNALAAAFLTLLTPSCIHTLEEEFNGRRLPEGTPITMRLDFNADDLITLNVSTKAEATPADEERIHDLYVMIFDDSDADKAKIYGRYFSYEHLKSSLDVLDNSPNEGWWVENRTLDNAATPVAKTRGVVKISTRVCANAKLVVIANIDNGICKLGDENGFEDDVLSYLNGIRKWSDLQATQVKLSQDIVNRKDLFLMLGEPLDNSGNPKTVNTEDMVWWETKEPVSYNEDFKVCLKPVDAKVRFKVRINERDGAGAVINNYISAAKAVYWEVDNVPDRCFLFSDANGGNAPAGTVYFDSEQAYFEGTVTEENVEWHVFSFYMLESRFAAKAQAGTYHDREKQAKNETGKTGYGGNDQEHYVENGEWIYAMPHAPYVKFDMILTLTPAGVSALGGSVNHALTSDTIYTIHLGDFSNAGIDDYNTLRSTCYTYEITIANSGSIYAEVINDSEVQPGQEGYLLLTDDEIVNADCHYEYHSITFTYDPETSPEKFSWYVKTPFTSSVGGGPQKGTKNVGGIDYPVYDPHDTDGTLLDYRWVKFGINKLDPNTGSYSTNRLAYPGDDRYVKDWGVGEHGPWDGTPHPELMDISQLIQYIFQETDKERDTGSSDFKTDTQTGEKIIRATIFINEYYYEVDPRDESDTPQPDPNLWRQFVNAQPREMHILSKTVQSRDQKSDVIESSHSVIQQSIQTIYNIYEPTLRSIWGCEHLDEIKQKPNGAGNWIYWPANCSDEPERYGDNSDIGKENGRLNSAYIWGVYNRQDNNGSMVSPAREWNNFLNYEVDNIMPELRDDDISDDYGPTHHYRGMAWSCLIRNRDNNGNGTIDPEEIRWYMASTHQLTGIWVGRESLSTSARLYQPTAGQWRSHVMSSTNKLVAWAEEGAGATEYRFDFAGSGGSGGPNTDYHTWATQADAAVGESVRCVRNIGTYDDNGVVTDISYAPVTVVPDSYFTLKLSDGNTESDNLSYDNSDKYYVFHFDRLNTKSIREYSPGELPYHDQTSLNNRVYVKLLTQPLGSDVPGYSVQLGDINNIVTQAGHNDYCPEGYRFPNHTEWLLMGLYLPARYLNKDKDNNNYVGTKAFPSRTYYDRGYYGSLRSETAAWSTEKNKVGWIYSNKMHCSAYNQAVTYSRCVKDEDQTGVISGRIAIEGSVIYSGDTIPIDFKFSSTASTFTNATMTLWYTKNGFRTPYDLTSQLKTPTGLQYKGAQEITIPTLAELGLTNPADIAGYDGAGIDMSIEVEFTNLNGRTGGHELDVKMKNPLNATLTVPDNHFYPNDTQGGRIEYSFSSAARNVDLESVSITLSYTDQNDQLQETDITGGLTVSGKNTSGVKILEIPSLSDLGLNTLGFNLNRPMTLSATVTGTNNTSITKSSNVTLVSHLAGSSVQFPTAYDSTNGIPVDVIAETVNDRATVSSAKLYWKRSGDAEYQEGAPLSGAGTSNMSTRTYVKTIIGQDLSESNKGKYYFYLTAECSDGTSIRSDVWSMDILYYGKCWNVDQGTWSKAGDIKNKWNVESITNLNFSAGDYFDAFIDVRNCTYIYYDGSTANDIGMDNLITIGTSADLNWKNGDIYFYYPANNPAEAPGENRLQVSIKDNNNTVTRLRPYDLSGSMTVRLSKDSLLVNGAELDYSQVKPGGNTSGSDSVTRSKATIEYITNQSTIKIGSVEGAHRSRATYNYVRVIRKETSEP